MALKQPYIWDKIDNIETNVGTLGSLSTSEKSNLVGAINENVTNINSTNTKIGTLTNLATTVKDNIVNSINELHDDIDNVILGSVTDGSIIDSKLDPNGIRSTVATNTTNIGTLSELPTTDKTSLVNSLKEINTDLVENQNLFKDSNRAKFGTSIKWLPTTATIDKWVENGIEEITYIPMIKYNTDTSTWGRYYPYGDTFENYLATTKTILNYAYSKGIKIVCIKVHSCYGNTTTLTSEADQTQVESNLANFKTVYKQFVLDIYNDFKNETWFTDTKYFCVLNEKEYMYSNTANYETFILDLISTMKAYNFKVGVANAGIYYGAKKLSTNVKNAVDVFFLNEYPSISFRGNKATMQESIDAWNSTQHISALEHLKSFGKELILSETGTMDYYEYLASPSSYGWDTGSLTASVNGEVGIIYIGGLLKSNVMKYFTRFWLQFEDTFLKSDVKVYFDKYKGGAL